jgi:hypothetical protein
VWLIFKLGAERVGSALSETPFDNSLAAAPSRTLVMPMLLPSRLSYVVGDEMRVQSSVVDCQRGLGAQRVRSPMGSRHAARDGG